MRLTAALLATLALLCTVFNLAQAAPLAPSRNDAEACARPTDCDSCVHASRCGFSLDTQSFAANDGHAGKFATSATQCKKAIAIHAAREWYVAARADVASTREETRVLDRRSTKPYVCRWCASTMIEIRFCHNAAIASRVGRFQRTGGSFAVTQFKHDCSLFPTQGTISRWILSI